MASVKLILNRHRALKSGAYPLVFQLIEFGVMIIAFKSALKSVLANPWAAIAIGAAMVAAAAVMTALINKNAEKSEPALAKGGLAYGPTYAMVGLSLIHI